MLGMQLGGQKKDELWDELHLGSTVQTLPSFLPSFEYTLGNRETTWISRDVNSCANLSLRALEEETFKYSYRSAMLMS